MRDGDLQQWGFEVPNPMLENRDQNQEILSPMLDVWLDIEASNTNIEFSQDHSVAILDSGVEDRNLTT